MFELKFVSLMPQDLLDMIMGSVLAKCAATDLTIQWLGWALASAFKTEKFYDLAGNDLFQDAVIRVSCTNTFI